MKQRIISLILAAAMVCGLFVGLAPKAQALHLWLKDRSAVSGSDYTDSDKMAQKLDEIFDGSLSLYSNTGCTTAVSAPIGSSVMKNNGVAMYVGPYGGTAVNSGTSCWIYAQGVYYTLFQDYVLNNKGKTGNSENVDMTTTSTTNCTYENFKAWGVRQGVGAMMRSAGHSMILLGYDEEKMITLEGNADGAGLVCIRERSWDVLESKYTSFVFIVQPTDAYMQENYDACRHENMSSLGACPDCGYSYNWARTLDSSAAGYYSLKATCTPKTEPYSVAESTSAVLATGELVEVQGVVTNYFGESWYALLLEDGSTGYAPAELMDFWEILPLQVTCSNFKPADGLALKAASYPLAGTVTSNYPMKQIDAYLDGVWYAKWSASDTSTTQVALNPTDINMDLAFSKLEQGKHVIKLVATSYEHAEPVTFHVSCFYIVGDDECLHTYEYAITTYPTCTTAGELTYTCSLCGDSYTETVAAPGHSYSNGYCTVCGTLDFDYVFETATLQVGTVEGMPGETVTVPVNIENNQCFAKFSFTVSYDTASMTLTGAQAGGLLQNGSFTQSGGTINWSSDANITGDGTLFYLSFTLAESAAVGSYEVKVALKSNSTYYFRDENNNARDLELKSGAVVCTNTPAVSLYSGETELGGYSTLKGALESYDSQTQYLKLNRSQTASAALTQDLYIDLNGFDLDGVIETGGYAVYGMDSSTDEYTGENVGYFSCVDSTGAAIVPAAVVKTDITGSARTYLTIESDDGCTFHRVYLGITYASVKPSAKGVGYKAVVYGDDMVMTEIDIFGYSMQLSGHEAVTVSKTGTELTSGGYVTLRVENYNADKYSETGLTATVYITVGDQTIESAAVTMTLRQMVEKINDLTLTDGQKTALAAWIAESETMQTWDVGNICTAE